MEKRFLVLVLAFLALLSAGYALFYGFGPSEMEEPPAQTTPAPATPAPTYTAAPEVKESPLPLPTPAPGEDFVPHLYTEWYVAQTMKEVTSLVAVKGKVKEWDGDGTNDGFNFYLKPIAEDGSVVPVDARVEVEAYSVATGDTSGFPYRKNELVYSSKTEIEAERFIVYEILGEVVESQEIRVYWKDITQYPASLSDYGMLYATIKTEHGNFSANLGESDLSKMVPLRETE